jgi:hypothetical protein
LSFLSRFHRVRAFGPTDPDQLYKSPDLICLVVMPPASVLRQKKNVNPRDFPSKNLEKEQYLVYFDQSKQNQRPFRGKILGREVKLDIISEWLHFCHSHHEGKGQRATSTVRALRVIDCRDGMVVPAPPSCLYVALSYVWGQHVPSSEEGERLEDDTGSPLSLPKTLPNVIRDAIAFTRNLGFSYLWVDKYCIAQVDPDLRQE